MLNQKGISRAVVLLSIIALMLLIAIAVPIVLSKTEQVAKDMDDLYVKAAEDEAYLRWVQDSKPFSGIYDTENKKFIEGNQDISEVTAYGTSKGHEGQVIYLKIDEKGNISTKWVDKDYLSRP